MCNSCLQWLIWGIIRICYVIRDLINCSISIDLMGLPCCVCVCVCVCGELVRIRLKPEVVIWLCNVMSLANWYRGLGSLSPFSFNNTFCR